MPVQYERKGEFALITIDNPPVNALSREVRAGLVEAVERYDNDDGAQVGILVCAGRTFIAGADIREFGKPPQEPFLPDVVNRIEACVKPIVAVLHGTTLGGGLEVAMGCHYRIAMGGTKLGLPEVNLGIMPGAGGTQRLPRLVGLEAALDMMTSGRPISADRAKELGLIEVIFTNQEPVEAGLDFARSLVDRSAPTIRTSELNDKLDDPASSAPLLEDWREKLSRKRRGEIAPQKIISALKIAYSEPFEIGLAKERELFSELMESDQRKGLIHAFFSERKVAKIPELKQAGPRPVETVGVIGGGTMGAGIAVAHLLSGLTVIMIERDKDSLERGIANLEGILKGSVARGKISAEQKQTLMDQKFSSSLRYDDLQSADIVIEAAFEDLAVKQDIFRQLNRACKPGCVLATNTSYLDINLIADVTARPEDVIGLHFFSPAHVMKLLEVVVPDKTAPDVVATGFSLAKRLGKVAVRAGVCDGFIGNRILSTYRKCADYMVLDGASPYQVDRAVTEFGLPMGPFAMADLAGLDIGWANRKRLASARAVRERYATFSDKICENGWFGRKTGQGFYIYDEETPSGRPNPAVEHIIDTERSDAGLVTQDFSDAEIMRRYMAAMINEGANVLGAKIAQRPLDVDVTMLYGYGFPRWRGGPMKYADMIGLDRVLHDIRTFETEDAYFWQPSTLLVELVESDRSFESLNDER
ncbi:MAG: 3-hydroxyacyl-CoA dehydrogenase NAD-binding domain-containing protein [Stappiaceae bacterium]